MAAKFPRAGDIPESSVWQKVVARYNRPDIRRSILMLAESVVPYVAILWLMFRCLAVSPWLTVALSVPAAGFQVRLFIVFHDCGHGSFFRSRRACDALGAVLGVVVFTPYRKWTREHAVHHATVGDLDRRGTGDVWTMTKREYERAPYLTKAVYRIFRNPFFLFGIGAFVMFLALHRYHGNPRDREGMASVYGTDLALAAVLTPLGFLVGIRALALVLLPTLWIASAAGVFLFYVQHQFEGVQWCRRGRWDYATVALKGASFLRLPRVLQWFTGNIGFHHVHHLSPRIPSYRLPACNRENALFRVSTRLSLLAAFRCGALKVWDELDQRLVGFPKSRAADRRPNRFESWIPS